MTQIYFYLAQEWPDINAMPFLPKVCQESGHFGKAFVLPHLPILYVLRDKAETRGSGHPRTWQKPERVRDTFLALCTLFVCVCVCTYAYEVVSQKRNLGARLLPGDHVIR